MATARKTLSVDLVPMHQARLHHSITTIHLQHQAMNVRHQFFFHLVKMRCNDPTQQQAAQSRSRIHREHQIAERQPSRRRLGTRVEDFHLGKKL
jgi:hypothetical protein